MRCVLGPRRQAAGGSPAPLCSLPPTHIPHLHPPPVPPPCCPRLPSPHHTTPLQALRLLLARGRPSVLGSTPLPLHIGAAHSRNGEQCVVLRLLRDTAFRVS